MKLSFFIIIFQVNVIEIFVLSLWGAVHEAVTVAFRDALEALMCTS
jgi:hypothetical protein